MPICQDCGLSMSVLHAMEAGDCPDCGGSFFVGVD